MTGYKTAVAEGLGFLLARQKMGPIHTQVSKNTQRENSSTFLKGLLTEREGEFCVRLESVRRRFFCVGMSSFSPWPSSAGRVRFPIFSFLLNKHIKCQIATTQSHMWMKTHLYIRHKNLQQLLFSPREALQNFLAGNEAYRTHLSSQN